MAVYKASAPFHWFGRDYVTDETIDTTGYGDTDVRRLLTHAPVYVYQPDAAETDPVAGPEVAAETSRATSAETAETTRATGAETTEASARAAADTAEATTRAAETTRATGAETTEASARAAALTSAEAFATAAVAAQHIADNGSYAPIGNFQPTGKYPPPRINRTVQTIFAAGHGYTVNGNAAPSNLNDTSDFALGTQAVQVTAPGNGAQANLTKSGQAARDLTGIGAFEVMVKVDDVTHLGNLYLYLGTGGFAAFRVLKLYSLVLGVTQKPLVSGEWTRLTVPMSAATVTGAPNMAAVTDWQLSATSDGLGTAVTVHWGGIATVPKSTAYTSGVVSITFDDCWQSQWDYGRAALDKYGYPATDFVIVDQVGTASHLTIAELQALERVNGWEVAGHAFTLAAHNVGFPALAAADLDTELRGLKGWLVGNGFRGANQLCYPLGNWNAAVELNVREYFLSARTSVDARYSGHETLPAPASRYRLRSLSCGGPLSLASIEAEVDAAFTNDDWLILQFHELVPGIGVGGTGTQFDSGSFATLVDYLNTKGVAVRTIGDVLATST